MAIDGVDNLTILVDVARVLGETFALPPLLDAVEQAGRSAMRCERATVFLYDQPTNELYSAVATGEKAIRFCADIGIAGVSAQTGSVIVVPDAYADPRFNREIDRQTGFRTRNMLTLPMTAPDGEVIGVLQVLNKLGEPFTRDDERLAGALGALTGVAIKRQMLLEEADEKRRLQRDLDIARDIQQQLLPASAPAVRGFDIAGWNRPADQTGGDCFDYFELGEDRVAILVADVTGHGIGPALIASQCRALFRATIDGSDDLATAGAKINRLLAADLPSDRFVTAWVGVLDARANRLEYLSGGHGPLILYRAASDTFERFAATGMPMGIMPDAPIDVAAPITFEVGDLFAVLTDGFVEWTDGAGTAYGEDRLLSAIRASADGTCEQLIQAIYQDVRRVVRDAPQQDDLTAVIIKRTA